MSLRILLFVSLVVVSIRAAAIWSPNINNLYKSRSILPVPGATSASLMTSIASGVQKAMNYCQNVFKWDRWNCPESTFTSRLKQRPNRETAYTKAILAAGVVHTITKNCSRGEIKGCGCDPSLGGPTTALINGTMSMNFSTTTSRTNTWSWSGCSDDPTYALEITKKFLDGLEKGTGAADYVSRHNSRVGREVVRASMVRKCRCHGVSGSCSLQTCWMQMAPFEVVAKKLREMYKKALRLTDKVVESSIVIGNSARQIAEEVDLSGRGKHLVFLEQSPDYCVPNESEGFPGTKGRSCSKNFDNDQNVTLAEKRSCRHLCRDCGYKVKKIQKEVRKTCNCKFVYCCYVECQSCLETVEEYFCD